jgi:PPM family protein phosphatase
LSSAHVAAASSTGLVRGRNEDSAYAGRWLCAVADGMGGHAAGDVASATVIEAIQDFDVGASDPGQLTAILGAAVHEANEQLTGRVRVDPGLASMGSTLTAMLWLGNNVAVANIGDSRAYLLKNRVLRQITEDHILANLVASPMPAQTAGYLVRYLDARPGWSPDLTLRAAHPGDRFLICSDGLSSVVGPDAIRDVLADADDPDQAVTDLTRLADEGGAPDNVTLIVAEVPDGTWHERHGVPLVLGAAANLAETGLVGVADVLGPGPRSGLVSVELVDGLDPVAGDHVLGDLDRVAI